MTWVFGSNAKNRHVHEKQPRNCNKSDIFNSKKGIRRARKVYEDQSVMESVANKITY